MEEINISKRKNMREFKSKENYVFLFDKRYEKKKRFSSVSDGKTLN